MNDSVRHSRRTLWTHARSLLAGALALGWSSACTGFGDDVPVEDLGDTNGGLGAAEPLPEKEYPEQIDPGFAGRWVGYVENPFERDESGQALPVAFPSGSTEVTLDYRFERFEQVIIVPFATLVFGAGPTPIPEPGVAYPLGVHHYFAQAANRTSRAFRAPVVEGFEYQLSEPLNRFAGYDPGRASMLGFTELAAFEEWCSLQGPLSSGDFDCLGPKDGFSGGDPEGTGSDPCLVIRPDRSQEEVDCDFAAMCMSDLCSCDGGYCSFNRPESVAQVFLERHGDQIIGTLSGAMLESDNPAWLMPMGTLRLFRAD
jgi:hypothetical protein